MPPAASPTATSVLGQAGFFAGRSAQGGSGHGRSVRDRADHAGLLREDGANPAAANPGLARPPSPAPTANAAIAAQRRQASGSPREVGGLTQRGGSRRGGIQRGGSQRGASQRGASGIETARAAPMVAPATSGTVPGVTTSQPTAQSPVARILTIGDELTFGEVIDRNKAHMARRCRALGIVVESMVTVRDRVDEIVAALHDAAFAAGVDVVLCSGGLGPTTDDLTAEAVAKAAGVPLARDADSLAKIEMIFASRGREVLEINRKQADLPAGGVVLANPIGTAPGFAVELVPASQSVQHDGDPTALPSRPPCLVCCMPGVPREMHRMLAEQVEPRLRSRLALDPAPARIYRVFGRGESQVQEAITPVLRELAGRAPIFASVLVHYRAHQGEVLVQLEATRAATGERAALEDLHAFDAPFREVLGRDLYGIGELDLPTRIVRAASAASLRIAGAESCTGGLASVLLTDVAGASACFVGTHVTYANAAKSAHLAVPDDLLAAHGAVSQPVAEAMARGAQRAFDADVAFAITGIAGPDGGSAEKPVGTVFLAVADRAGQVVHRRVRLPGDRDFIRRTASLGALRLVWDFLVDRGAASVEELPNA